MREVSDGRHLKGGAHLFYVLRITHHVLLMEQLQTKIQELKEYDEKLKTDNQKLTYENLCFNFGKDFIEECKKRKILIPLPDGNYDFRG